MGFGLGAKKVEGVQGDDGLKTVECLRGRLLAERVASKAANEEADNLGIKVCIFCHFYYWFRL